MSRWQLGLGTALAASAAAVGAIWAALRAGTGEDESRGGLHPWPRTIPFCNCARDGLGGMDEGIARCQLASDFLIALAYFSIPLELVYFFLRSNVFPHRWMLLQFGLFIVFCGLTHVVNIWTYGPHPHSIALLQTVLKVLTAAVSCATAFLLVTVIPALLNVKVRELFLQHKASQLDRQMDVMKRREEAGRQVALLTSRIRQTLDRHTILNTTLVEVAQALALDNCTIWMPHPRSKALELTHELERRMVQEPVVVPVAEPTVQSILQTNKALRISPSSPLGKASSPRNVHNCSMAAIRIPILPVGESLRDLGSTQNSGGSGNSWGVAGGGTATATGGGGAAGTVPGVGTPSAAVPVREDSPLNSMKFGIMVLVIRGDGRRQWRSHEVEMMEMVADQVAIALCHATVLEESQRRHNELLELNYALDVARDRAEMAVRARNDFLTVMNHELRTPLHDIFGIISLLQLEDAPLAREQRSMLGVVMRSSRLMCSMVQDVLAFSRMEENALILEYAAFDLHLVLRDAAQLSWPLAHAKGLSFSYNVGESMPRWVVGDDRRLLQMILNVIARAVECTPKGVVTVNVDVDRSNRPMSTPSRPDPVHQQPWEMAPTQDHFVLRVDVTDMGLGHAEGEASEQFQVFGLAKAEGGTLACVPLPSADSAREGQSGRHVARQETVGPAAEKPNAGVSFEEAFRGAGLALMICQKFAEMMGGSVCISSQGRGRGSTVTFTVQLERDIVAVKRKTQQQQRIEIEDGPHDSSDSEGMETEWEVLDSYIGDLEGLHVLVVEDNPSNQQTSRLQLERLLCRVSVAGSAAECWAQLQRTGANEAVDVVLLDVCLPSVDGLEVARRICQMFRADERPLLLGLTARTNSGMHEACRNAGMDAVLFKPVTLLDLGSALCEVLTANG